MSKSVMMSEKKTITTRSVNNKLEGCQLGSGYSSSVWRAVKFMGYVRR